jgi:hypothetical protein
MVLFQKIQGEATSVPESQCNDWKLNKLPLIIKDYEEKDIFNGDEFELFWRLLHKKTIIVKGKPFKTEKSSKDRVSVFLCSNMDGSEKLKPIVIGKYQTPRCLKNKKRLPVVYRYNKNAWMRSEIFKEFLIKFNRKMIKENRKIWLFVDNCSTHPFINLSNIKLVFLPPNTTSRLQPMDQGIIHCLKSYYRRKFVQKLIAIIDAKQIPTAKSIDLFDAINFLNSSWNDVSLNTIQNCFKKSGFIISNSDNNSVSDIEEDLNEDINNLWQELGQNLDLGNTSFEEFVNCDDSLITSELCNDNSASVSNSENCNTEINNETEEMEIETENESEHELESEDNPVSLLDALTGIKQVRKYVAQFDNLNDVNDLINNLENAIYKTRFNNLRQTVITDYFRRNLM